MTTNWADLPQAGETLYCKGCGMMLDCTVSCGTSNTHHASLVCCGQKLGRYIKHSFEPLKIEVTDAEPADSSDDTSTGSGDR